MHATVQSALSKAGVHLLLPYSVTAAVTDDCGAIDGRGGASAMLRGCSDACTAAAQVAKSAHTRHKPMLVPPNKWQRHMTRVHLTFETCMMRAREQRENRRLLGAADRIAAAGLGGGLSRVPPPPTPTPPTPTHPPIRAPAWAPQRHAVTVRGFPRAHMQLLEVQAVMTAWAGQSASAVEEGDAVQRLDQRLGVSRSALLSSQRSRKVSITCPAGGCRSSRVRQYFPAPPLLLLIMDNNLIISILHT